MRASNAHGYSATHTQHHKTPTKATKKKHIEQKHTPKYTHKREKKRRGDRENENEWGQT